MGSLSSCFCLWPLGGKLLGEASILRVSLRVNTRRVRTTRGAGHRHDTIRSSSAVDRALCDFFPRRGFSRFSGEIQVNFHARAHTMVPGDIGKDST